VRRSSAKRARNAAALGNPVRDATSSTGNDVDSSSSLARSRRIPNTQRFGLTPVSAWNRRVYVDPIVRTQKHRGLARAAATVLPVSASGSDRLTPGCRALRKVRAEASAARCLRKYARAHVSGRCRV
jgi:hypothetical protein